MSYFLIHGWATTASIWPDWLLNATTHSYQSPQYPNYEHLAKAFINYYEKQGKPITIVGWSLGGMLALQLAADYPEKIKNLILFSTTARFTSCENYTAGLAPSIVKNLARRLLKNSWQTQLDFYHLMFANHEESYWETFSSQLAPKLAKIEMPTLQAGLHYLLEIDLRSLLPIIETPCQILHGSSDTICPPAAAQYLVEQLPNATLTILPDAGHIPFYTQRDVCNVQLQKAITYQHIMQEESAIL